MSELVSRGACRINPYLRQRRLRWRNRVDGWRGAPAEPLFHVVMSAGLLGLLGWLLLAGLRSHGAALFAALDAHALALAIAAFLLGWMDSRGRLQSQREQWRRGWLGAQPIAERERRSALGLLLLRRLAVAWAALCVLWLAALASAASPTGLPLLAVTFALAGGAALAWWRDRPRVAANAQAGPIDAHALAGMGSLWRWQRAALRGARRGRSLAPGLWLLLLVPIGKYHLAVVAVLLLVLLSLAAFAAGWRLALRVLVDAAAWLAPQPWPSRCFLRAGLPLPLTLLVLFLAFLAPLAFGLGALVTLGLAALVAAFALLQLLVVAATRRRPSQILPLLALHGGLLLACLAVLPPLAPLLWLLQVVWLSRKALQ